MDFDLSNLRLQNQHLTMPVFSNPADVVKYLGAVQSQDYTGAKWALGMRLINGTDDLIEKAFAKGDIIRTHVMRPTWHFVHRDDLPTRCLTTVYSKVKSLTTMKRLLN
jgi:hypothetical protein